MPVSNTLLLAFLLFSWSCGGDRTPPRIVGAAKFTPNANAAAPLSGTLELTTDEPARVEPAILVAGEDGRALRTAPETGYSVAHVLPVLGAPADSEVELEVALVDAAGNRSVHGERLRWRTPPLPAGFPPLQVIQRDPGRMEPGVTFFNARGSGPPAVPPSSAYLIMIDDAGRVVWWYESASDITAASRMRNGHLLYLSGRRTAVEIDLQGNVVQQWYAARLGTAEMPAGATPVDVDTLHHDLHELPEGSNADFIAVSTELREYEDYPSNERLQELERRTSMVAGDLIVEFRRDGSVVRRLPLLDVLDPRRVCYESLLDFWNHTYGDVKTDDWAHTNAVIVDPRDGNYVISCRNQDAVLKVERATGKLLWLLGPPLNWETPFRELLLEPIGEPFEWFYKQHAPRLLPNGDLVLFDNGNQRATPPMIELRDPARYSRAVVYHIDEAAGTVRQVWSYGDPADPWYSFFLGGVEVLPRTGNLLVTDGGKQISPSVRQGFARIFEITRDARIVFELVVRDSAPVDALSWNVYRSERLPAVQPAR